jgi:membrane protease YdiL (CAAX protease family)
MTYPMETVSSKLFTWRPSRNTLIPTFAGLVVLSLSVSMILIHHIPWLSTIIRDIFQVFLVGIVFPLVYIHRSGNHFSEFGLSLKKWYLFLPINFTLGILLFFMFLSGSPPPAEFRLNASVLWTVAYVMCALVFELIFFYGFLRGLFERDFGIVPGIVLACLVYAFHHVGFQPEYGKLFLVGLMYATVYRLGNSALLIFPFFLGVGGTYDVLVQSQVVSPILYPRMRASYLSVLILATVIWIWKNARSSSTFSNKTGSLDLQAPIPYSLLRKK